ncbi:MAG: type II toxin-antitoxin system PemK/MazF family toxin [Lacisediminihabitans sp.]
MDCYPRRRGLVAVINRGEIYWMDFGVPSGSAQGFRRPVLVVQDNRFNRSAISTCIVSALTRWMLACA